MAVNLKSSFALESKFTSYYSDPNPIFLCDDGTIVCGRDEDSQLIVSLCQLYGSKKFVACEGIADKVSTYVASTVDNVVYFAMKNLFLVRYDRSIGKVISRWNSSHSKPVVIMSLNSCSTRLATGSSDCSIRIWHIGSGEGFVTSCKGHSSKITLLKFHPSKQLLFSCSLGEVDLVVWNSETGAKLRTLKGHQGNVTDIAFSPSGDQFATSSHDKVVIVWCTIGLTRLKTIPMFESLQSIVYLSPGSLKSFIPPPQSENTSYLVSGGQWGIARVWDIETSRCILEIRGPRCRTSDSIEMQSHDFGLHSISKLSLFRGSTDVEKPFVLMISRRSSHVEFYDAEYFKLIYEFIGEIGSVDQLCLMGAARNRLVLADVSANLKLFAHPPGSAAVDSTIDSSLSWSCQLVQSPHTGVIGDMTVSNCGFWLLSGGRDQVLCLWELEESSEDRPRLLAKACTRDAHDAHISAVCFARNVPAVFSASTDGVLKSWVVDFEAISKSDGKMETLVEGQCVRNAHAGAINCIHVSSNGRFMATGSRDKTAKVWLLDSLLSGRDMLPKLVGSLTGHSRGVWSVRFSDYERVLLTASGDKDLRLWNLKDMTCIQTFEGHEEPVYRAEFISKGRQIVSCDQKGLIRLWTLSKQKKGVAALTEGQKMHNFIEAHQGRVWALAICPDESGFYTGGEDATVCFFRDRSGEIAQENAEATDEFIKTYQEFENLLRSKKCRKALRLAIRLDKPHRTFEILQEIALMEGLAEEREQAAGKMAKLRAMERALFSLVPCGQQDNGSARLEEMGQRLLRYATQWNTRARTCLVAQRVFNWVVSNWAPGRLLKWPGIGHAVAAFTSYTSRHYQRLNRLEEQMTVMDYLFEASRQNQILHLAESQAVEWAEEPTTSQMETDESQSVPTA